LDDQRRTLAHAAEGAAVVELSSAMVNELSQPLTAILANAPAGQQLLARQPIDMGELSATLSEIECEAGNAAGILQQLRGCARGEEPAFELLDIEDVARRALSLSRDALTLAHVDLQIEIAPSLPRVRADPVQLLQVMLTLIAHSSYSMSTAATPRQRLRLQVTQPDRDHVEVVVADSWSPLPNGGGERAFEHLFAGEHGGIALKLTIARSIARAHGGHLRAAPNEYGGATFHLVLPAVLP
jgi:C4-dicarboxylate-specific signal transduction histidine kinase